MTCQKCKKTKAVVNHKGGHYCTWYCAKKGNLGSLKVVDIPGFEGTMDELDNLVNIS